MKRDQENSKPGASSGKRGEEGLVSRTVSYELNLCLSLHEIQAKIEITFSYSCQIMSLNAKQIPKILAIFNSSQVVNSAVHILSSNPTKGPEILDILMVVISHIHKLRPSTFLKDAPAFQHHLCTPVMGGCSPVSYVNLQRVLGGFLQHLMLSHPIGKNYHCIKKTTLHATVVN